MELNQNVPDFCLPDQQGNVHALSEYRGRIVVVHFWSAECPWSERADQQLMEVSKRFPGDLVILPVASNRNETTEMISQAAQQRGLDFVLVDGGCQLADAWDAQITPHVFVIDSTGILRYQGALDDVTFRKRTPEHYYAEAAVEALTADQIPEIQEIQPYGCTIVRAR